MQFKRFRKVFRCIQVTFSFRYVDVKFYAHETLFGWYKTASTTSENLFEICNDVLRRFGMNINTCTELFTYDAANIRGAHTGFQSRIKTLRHFFESSNEHGHP